MTSPPIITCYNACMDGATPHILPNIPRSSTSSQTLAPPYEPVCDFRRYLHGEKLKFTPEPAMMLDAVCARDELFEARSSWWTISSGLGYRVSRATVYRTLSHLQDAGILRQVFFDNKRSYYEVIAGRQQNDYLICVETGQVIEFNSDRLRVLCDETAKSTGLSRCHINSTSSESPQRPGKRRRSSRSRRRLDSGGGRCDELELRFFIDRLDQFSRDAIIDLGGAVNLHGICTTNSRPASTNRRRPSGLGSPMLTCSVLLISRCCDSTAS